MDALTLLRAFAAVTTVIAALMVASNWGPKTMVAGFVVFIVASIAWLIDGWLEDKSALVIQNAILFLINIVGVYRWLPKAVEGDAPKVDNPNWGVGLVKTLAWVRRSALKR